MPTVLERYRDIIREYRISAFEQAGTSFRFRARLFLVDGSQLDIRETVIGGETGKYSFHWQDESNKLRVRWDNAPDWDVETFPHHKHVDDEERAGLI